MVNYSRNPLGRYFFATREMSLGPFNGGINTYSDPSKIADNELSDCRNFDITLDGALTSRPPWSTLNGQFTISSATGANPPDSSQIIIGTGSFEGDRYIIVNSTHTGAAASYIYYVDGVNAGLLAKIADGVHSKAHRYANDLYLVPDIGNPGVGCTYDLGGGLVTIVPSMPMGYASVVYKDRLWIGGRRNETLDSRVFFSDLATFDSWPGTNFFDINAGDGDAVNELVVYQDNIVIFKDSATYVLTYDTGPAQAVLQLVNGDIGVQGRNCVDVYENSIFLLKYNQVYEMSNYDFVRVSVKIPFEYDNTVPTAPPYSAGGQAFKYPFWLRVVGDRAVVRFYNRLYVYHLRLRAWTRWESQDTNIHYIGPIMKLDNTNTDLLQGFNTYVAGSSLIKGMDGFGPGTSGAWKMYFKLFKMEDRYEISNTERGEIAFLTSDIKLRMVTKQFDVGMGHRFKRLLHWGVDCYTGREITGTLIPFSVAYKVTWDQLATKHWHELGTWDYPVTALPTTTQLSPTGTGKQIKFVRFPKSLRFRLLQFRVDMATVGNTTDGEASLYTITAFIAIKQVVPKAVS
jgi:hypothetical protein